MNGFKDIGITVIGFIIFILMSFTINKLFLNTYQDHLKDQMIQITKTLDNKLEEKLNALDEKLEKRLNEKIKNLTIKFSNEVDYIIANINMHSVHPVYGNYTKIDPDKKTICPPYLSCALKDVHNIDYFLSRY